MLTLCDTNAACLGTGLAEPGLAEPGLAEPGSSPCRAVPCRAPGWQRHTAVPQQAAVRGNFCSSTMLPVSSPRANFNRRAAVSVCQKPDPPLTSNLPPWLPPERDTHTDQQPGPPLFEAVCPLGLCVPLYLHPEAEGEEKPLLPLRTQLMLQRGCKQHDGKKVLFQEARDP